MFTQTTSFLGKSIAVYVLVLLSIVPSFAQQRNSRGSDTRRIQTPAPPSDKLPFNAQVKKGKLPNGLTYYIRQNSKPEKRVELRLAVNAGSLLETDAQQGLAHFVEHMAFNGTKKYKKQEIINFLESAGVQFGAHLNAYTSFDETVYMLKIPTDKPGLVDKGLDIMREWAGNISFEAEEVDKERGVVIEEWRLGQGAGSRLREKTFPVILSGSQYMNRLPIGKKDVLENFNHAVLKQFYKDWYRPDLMALVVVGDVNPAQMEQNIRTMFGTLRNPTPKKTRTTYNVPDHADTKIAIATDPENDMNVVQVLYKHPVRDRSTKTAFREGLISGLYSGVLGERLDEITTQANPPFAFAGGGYGNFVRTKDNFGLFAAVPDGTYKKALDVLLTEAERMYQFGATQAEFDRQKADLLRGYERQFNERDKTDSRQYADEYVRVYLENEPSAGIEYEYNLVKELLPTIRLDEVNGYGKKYMTPSNRVVVIQGKEEADKPVPTQAEVLAILNGMANKKIEPPKTTTVATNLMSSLPTAGSIVKEDKNEALGVTRLTLSNGAQVILKPTAFKNDEILMQGTSRGGWSLTSPDKWASATMGNMLLRMSGVGNMSMTELQRFMAGKSASVSGAVGPRSESISGRASPKDLETFFQLMHLQFTAPRVDEAGYNAFKSQFQMIRNFFSTPEAVFQDSIQVTMTQRHPATRTITSYKIEEINKDDALALYKDRFADASDFQFYFVGNFDVAKMKEYAALYLASLPALKRNEAPKDLGIRAPKGIIEKKIFAGKEPKSSSQIQFTGDFEWSRENRIKLQTMARILEIRLREELREALGGSYYANASGSASKEPIPNYSVSIAYSSDPNRADELFQAVMRVINEMKTTGVSAENLTKVREISVRELETNLKENNYWMSMLIASDDRGEDPAFITAGALSIINALTSDDMKAAANRYLNDKNYARFVLLPEEKK